MKSGERTACILFDDDDMMDFKRDFKSRLPTEFVWFPLGCIPMMQLIWGSGNEKYFLPEITDDEDCGSLSGTIYQLSQEFLQQSLVENDFDREEDDFFPLEYYWMCIFFGAYRILSMCNSLIDQYPVTRVILIERNDQENFGGLLVNYLSFSDLMRDFFKDRGISVISLCNDRPVKRPKTLFYNQRNGLKSSVSHLLRFIRWKFLTINNKNNDYILVLPAYDNIVNYGKDFVYSAKKAMPQVFHGNKMPFLHSWRKLIRFSIAKLQINGRQTGDGKEKITPYKCLFHGFEFDIAEYFRPTVCRYLHDVRWMSRYIDMFWRICLENDRPYLSVFSLSPTHLHSYFLIKKTKQVRGSVAAWQHGGLYGYANHFVYSVSDYKNVDYFLSFGKNENRGSDTEPAGDNTSISEVGSNIFTKPDVQYSPSSDSFGAGEGLYIPSVVTDSYRDNRIKWDGPAQFCAVKVIIDFFNSPEKAALTVKGLTGHNPHRELNNYIKRTDKGKIFYREISVSEALERLPSWVILDGASTPLIEVLSQYRGPVFLLNLQESWAIDEDALGLLKRRVAFSQTVDELQEQLSEFFRSGSLNGIDVEDSSFVDTYVKRFSYPVYERFLRDAAQICQC